MNVEKRPGTCDDVVEVPNNSHLDELSTTLVAINQRIRIQPSEAIVAQASERF